MDDKDRKTLNDNLSRLSINCNFDYLQGYLTNIFTPRQLQMYQSESFMNKTEEMKCQQLFKDIQTRGPNAFKHLLQCLKYTGHTMQYEILSRGRGEDPSHGEDQPIRVKKSGTFHAPSQTVYKMTSDPRGYYIFINNIEFERNDDRIGAHFDEEFAKVLTDMGYEGTYHINQSKQAMWRLLKEFAAKDDLSKVDSLIVTISSHGKVTKTNELMIFSSDDKDDESDPILVNDVISLFDDCKLPKGQPKIFCINACRADAVGRTEIVQKRNMWMDTFCLAPCFEGTKANRFLNYGSWLFMALIEVLKDNACDMDLDQMKNLINDKFEEYYHSSHKVQTLSFYKYGVSKRLFFNPGLDGHSAHNTN